MDLNSPIFLCLCPLAARRAGDAGDAIFKLF